ncbi:DnaJ domain-containing protein [Micromonospora sp. LAH09]|nr:DnaJ domain-containing protein [Micromonospora cabrerizensis]
MTRESTVTEIRERYLVLVQIWHPDRHQSSPASVRDEVTRQMQQINAAYEHLTESHAREAHARQAREQQERERQARARQDSDRQASARQARERQDRERQDRERAARERPDPERQRKERQDRERETREREHPRARWTHPRFAIVRRQRGTPWGDTSTVHPIAIALRSGDTGYTLRAYFDDQRTEAAFPGAEEHLLLFRSMASMRQYLKRTEGHGLGDIPGWEGLLARINDPAAEPDDEHRYEFDLVLHSLRFPPFQWVPALFIASRDVIREISEAFDVDQVLGLLTVGSPLDELDDLFRSVDRPVAGWGARRRLGSLEGSQASTLWRKALRGVEERVRWVR